ncbi:MAG: MG2 domain-containing protein [Firmicutes bacterium]|nr:MG2 domain-containing protein [Bacillota bacterium]
MKSTAGFNKSKILIILFIIACSASMFSLGISKEKPKGAIKGKVYSSETGKPIAGAKVFYPNKDSWVKTDKNGEYILYGVPENKKGHSIRAFARGYEDTYRDKVKISESATVEGIDFKMVKRKSNFEVYAYQKVFPPSERPVVNISGYLVKKINIQVYKINPEKYLGNLTEYGKLSKIDLSKQKPVYETVFTGKLNDDGDYSTTWQVPYANESGVYIIKSSAIGGKQTHTTWLMKTDVGLIVKRSPKQILVYAQKFSDKKPVSGVKVVVLEENKKRNSGVTDKNGLFTARITSDKSIYLVANQGQNYAFSNAYSCYAPPDDKAYIYTDRPVYRPGQTVFFKGIFRHKKGFAYEVPEGKSIIVTINDSKGNLVYTKQLYTNKYGSFFGNLNLEGEAPLGGYSISAKSNDINESFYGYFDVSEYRKPEYKMEVTTDQPRYVCGDKIKVKVTGKYYFGAPVNGASFNITVIEDQFRWSNYEWEDYYGEDNSEHYGGIMFETKGKLDANGEAVVEIPTQAAEFDRILKIEVEATDISGRAVTADTSVPLSVGEYALYGFTRKYVYEPGEEVSLQVEARDFNEKPIADRNVRVDVKRVVYEEVEEKEAVHDDLGNRVVTSYRTERKEYPVGNSQTVRTDKDGNAVMRFTPSEQGSYMLALSSRDSRGNEIKYTAYTYIAKNDYDGSMAEAEIKIITDKKQYKPGETVKALLTSSEKNYYALLTIEGRDIYEKHVVYVKGGSKAFDIPLKQEYFPNVFISASLIKDMELVSATKDIRLVRDEKKLKVTVKPDKDRYHPGETAKYTVLVTDQKGEPVQAEISLGVVDEAVYAIKPDMTPNIHEFFWQYDPNCVQTNYSFSRDYSAGADKDRPDKIRKDFKDTAFWTPTAVTGPDGKVVLEFKMPDNLTTWVGTVRAATMDTRVGSSSNFVISTKDLLVRLETPRFMTQRDKLMIGGVVHNYTKKIQKIKVWLEAEGVELANTDRIAAVLKPEEAKDFYWEVEAVHPGEAKFTMLCMGDTANDAMELKVPIQPFGIEEISSQSGRIDDSGDSASIKLDLPENIIPEGTKLELLLSPTLAGGIIDNLSYLIHYPYGCVEQTMSSFMPALTANRVLKKFNISNPAIEQEIPKVVGKGLARLYELQHSDGGWGWWEDDATHPYMTAYVVMGFKEAQKNGYTVNAYSLNQGIAALKKMVEQKPAPVKTLGGSIQQGEEWNTRVYLLYALTKAGVVYKEKIKEVYDNRKDMNDYGIALLAMCLNSAGDAAGTAQVMSELDKRAKADDKECYWEGRTFTYSWVDNKVETTAYCLLAYLQIAPKDPKIPGIIRWFSGMRQGPSYDSTKDTAAVVYAFTEYLLKSGEMDPDYFLSVKLNDGKVLETPVKTAALSEKDASMTFDMKKVKTGANTIEISKKGKGYLYYTARLRYYPDYEEIKPVEKGIKVNRQYLSISKTTGKNGAITETTEPLTGAAIKRGDKIRVEVTVEADKDYQYVIIEDPLPAGFEVTIPEGERNTSGLWWCQREIRDEKAVFFANSLEKGKKLKLTYDLRAEMAGNVVALPTLAWAMYQPEIRGHSGDNKLSVEAVKDNQ